MNPSAASCDLCGLSLRYGTVKWTSGNRDFSFCCIGCRQVFIMLIEAADSSDPLFFKETELFNICKEMGIIPESESDLKERLRKDAAKPLFSSLHPSSEPQSERDNKTATETLTIYLKVRDMWCPACAWVIEAALKKHSGVTRSSCNFSTDRVRCDYNPIQTSPDKIIRTIGRLGYRAAIPEEDEKAIETKKDFTRFAISAFLTANIMMLSFALYSGFFTELTKEAVCKISVPIFILAGVVLFYGGFKIYRKALAGLKTAAFGMETLITLGAFSAFFYSTFNLFYGSIHLYFDTSAMLITLTLLGKTIERKAKDSVQEDLGNFFSLRPTKVNIISDEFPGGRYVSAEVLRKGDFFRVQEGEIAPADGRVLQGSGSMDESSLTGEALPVQIKTGDRIKSGTRLIQGDLKVRAEGVGDESTLGQMISIMERALEKKLPLEGKTDRVLRLFVPLILLLSSASGLVCLISGLTLENALIRSVTVMVVACPCALGIAIPMARVAGISLAGNKGILVRDFTAFEQAQTINAVVFDKTGTLTQGDWTLLDVRVIEPFLQDQIFSMAAALERHSDHYIAVEILRHADRDASLETSFEFVRNHQNGVSGTFREKEIRIGSKDFVEKNLTSPLGVLEAGQKDGTFQSKVYMSYGDQLCAVFTFGDTLKDTAINTIKTLRDKGHDIALVSGDGNQTTRAIGDVLGIRDAYGSRTPLDKAVFIQKRQQNGKKVAMVGDGINDAPALVQADLAMAVFSGSHLGKEVADITLMQGNPSQILEFFDLAKTVNQKIHQNFVFSFLYNFISIPIAMSGLLTPLVAVSAMLLSSLSVTGNTLLLKRKYTSIDLKPNREGSKL
jgi:heavy metal translocating P-type ATPase